MEERKKGKFDEISFSPKMLIEHISYIQALVLRKEARLKFRLFWSVFGCSVRSIHVSISTTIVAILAVLVASTQCAYLYSPYYSYAGSAYYTAPAVAAESYAPVYASPAYASAYEATAYVPSYAAAYASSPYAYVYGSNAAAKNAPEQSKFKSGLLSKH
uniref:Cuticle protein 16.5 n=1 Tax=Syphacia muris TaxID=451379 RepID=A0A0N5AW72_9BILA